MVDAIARVPKEAITGALDIRQEVSERLIFLKLLHYLSIGSIFNINNRYRNTKILSLLYTYV